MKTVKSLIIITAAMSITLGIFGSLLAQQNERKIAEGLNRLSDKSDFGWSETYTVINPKTIYLDADLDNFTATIYFSAHPVYRFAVELIDYESEAVSISGRYLELTGNGTAAFYIDRAEKKLFFKRRNPDGTVRKIFYGAVTIEQTPSKKERILLKRDTDLTFILHNTGAKICADFYYKDFFVFSLDAKQLKVKNSANPDVWDLTGNTSDILSLNTLRNILYYRAGNPRTTWATVLKAGTQ